MAKFGILGVSSENEVNIGDYVQALAAKQFLPSVDEVVQRERLKDYKGDPIKMIMNGWFIHHTDQWPPSKVIDPLFVAFHLNSLAKQSLLSKDSIEYLRNHQPIGCRDTATRDLLIQNGVDAYFSGCLTLTLGKTYKSENNSGKVYFVDPAFSFSKRRLKDIWLAFSTIFLHPISVIRLVWKNRRSVKYSLKGKILLPIHMARFFGEYVKFFDRQTLMDAEYICQQNEYIKKDYASEESLLEYAESLIKKYAEADFIVTSRIHCALPAIGLGTPVIYTMYEKDIDASKCRFGGLSDLFTLAYWDGENLRLDFTSNNKISSRDDIPNNKDSWKKFNAALVETVNKWLKHC